MRCDQALTVLCQAPQLSRARQAAHDLQVNPARRQVVQPLEQQLTLLERKLSCIRGGGGGAHAGISAGSTSLRECAQIRFEIIACPLAGHLGNAVGGTESENAGPDCTCLASTSQSFRSHTGETTSTEYLAWSSRVWKPARSGRCGLLSAGKDSCSGTVSTSSILKNRHGRFVGSRN